MSGNTKRDLMMLLVAAIVLALLPLIIGEYYAYLIRLMGIYLIAVLGLNVFMGYCGQINLGSAAFLCIGAYGTTILQTTLGWHYVAAFPVVMGLNFLVAWGISWPLLRLRGHTMAIGTIALSIAVYLLADRFPTITGGSDGISVPSMSLFGHMVGERFYYHIILAFAVLALLLCYFLINSPSGRAMKAVKEDEVAAAAMGVNVHRYKMLAWLVSGVFGGLAGSLYAQQAGFLSPQTFGIMANVTFLLMLIVGGMGTILGAIAGTVIMTLLSFFLVTIEEYIMLAQALVLFMVLRFLPGGVVGSITSFLRGRAAGKKPISELS